MPMILGKMMRKILCGNFEKSFLKWEKMASSKVFWHFHAKFFMFILLISNHTVFLVQFGINLHLWVFQKAEIARAASWKNSRGGSAGRFFLKLLFLIRETFFKVSAQNFCHQFTWYHWLRKSPIFYQPIIIQNYNM